MLWITKHCYPPHPPILLPIQLKRIWVLTDLSLLAFKIPQTALNFIPWYEKEMNWQSTYSKYCWDRKRRNPLWKYVQYNSILTAQHAWGDRRLYIHIYYFKAKWWQDACSHYIIVSIMVFLLIVVEEPVIIFFCSKAHLKTLLQTSGEKFWQYPLDSCTEVNEEALNRRPL